MKVLLENGTELSFNDNASVKFRKRLEKVFSTSVIRIIPSEVSTQDKKKQDNR